MRGEGRRRRSIASRSRYVQTKKNLSQRALAESLKSEVPTVEILTVDISDWSSTTRALQDLGPVDLLVNNAGEGMIKSLVDVEEQDVDR
jgi:short-subunit dehydrogenase